MGSRVAFAATSTAASRHLRHYSAAATAACGAPPRPSGFVTRGAALGAWRRRSALVPPPPAAAAAASTAAAAAAAARRRHSTMTATAGGNGTAGPSPSSFPSPPSSPATVATGPAGATYDFTALEKKWQAHWEEAGTFAVDAAAAAASGKPKFYALDMFPYPSGSGLHVGHPEGYTATDIMARYKRKTGHAVLHPMGWDAFGLPAEQYALATGTHPADTTARNIGRFREQLRSLGLSYDWAREVNTSEASYYKHTQWIFLQLFKRGLAYQSDVAVNWCPALGTVLANEEVIDGLSERGSHPVVRKPMRQWVLRITAYAERLLGDLEGLDWPESIKDMQRNWIGKSVGAELVFPIAGSPDSAGDETPRSASTGVGIAVYTTRPETVCGVTYLCVAPEYAGLDALVTPEQRDAVDAYVAAAAAKSDRERTGEGARTKSGVATGSFTVNPFTGDAVPVWVADYVLGGVGTGAVMAVPAHDNRDWAFAAAHGLPFVEVVAGGDVATAAFTGDGTVVNWDSSKSGVDLNGKASSEAKATLLDHLGTPDGAALGTPQTNYKLRDWLFSRQRYWGEPFPIVFVDGQPEAVDEASLPVVLPSVESYAPTGDGASPLAGVPGWVETTTADGRPAKRETNTMPQWAGSCWYYLRYIDPTNEGRPVDPALEKYWMPVDLYVGGVEHAVLHLLYARFWHKVLYDCGVVSTLEPFGRLVNQGMILGEVELTAYRTSPEDPEATPPVWVSAADVDTASNTVIATGAPVVPVSVTAAETAKDGAAGDALVLASDPTVRVLSRSHKMSKSRGNVVNPDAVVATYGADALRCYLMFMGPLEAVKPWGTTAVGGMARFLARAWRLVMASDDVAAGDLAPTFTDAPATADQRRVTHALIRRVSDDTEGMRFNTALAALMEFVNAATKWSTRPRECLEPFVSMLGVYAPHIGEELWERLGHPAGSLSDAPWPEAVEAYLAEATKVIVVQVNGKVRAKLTVDVGADKDTVLAAAGEAVDKWVGGGAVKKQIYVPGKLVNLVVPK